MNVSLTFFGAAQSVTGSKYLLEIDSKKILIDCGMFQGQKELRLRNWDKLPIDPSKIDLVVITHAHIDHTGYLPRLVKDGFNGKIICTHATEELIKIMLLDAAKLQEEEALFAMKRGYSKHNQPEPLFDTDDAKSVFLLIEHYTFEKKIDLLPNVSLTYHLAGHILGAAIAEITLHGGQQEKKIIFSGDLGRYNDPIMYDPTSISKADILLVESTYGDRINPMENIESDLIKIVTEAFQNNGVIVVPAFAVGRTQSLIYYFNKLMKSGAIPTLPIYIDSPMAISVTDLYERNSSIHKIKVEKERNKLISIFDSPNIHFCNTVDSSKALNEIKTPTIIISASGMATGGRILHHLYHRLRNTNDTILFAGYQAEESRGRKMIEGEKSVRIFGEEVPINCHVREIHGLSAHADQLELMRWLGNFTQIPKMTFVTHGELTSATTFSKLIEDKLNWRTTIPKYLEKVELFKGI